jgi:membrane protein
MSVEGNAVRARDRDASWWRVSWEMMQAFGAKNVSLLSAAVAFYAMLSIFPGLAALISTYGLVANPTIVAGQIDAARGVLPGEAAQLLSDELQALVHNAHSRLGIGLLISVFLLLWSARAAASSIITALNYIYGTEEKRSFLLTQAMSVILTVCSILFGVGGLTAVAVLPAIAQFLPFSDQARDLLSFSRWPVLILLAGTGFALMYRYAPCRLDSVRWRGIVIGALVGMLLWVGVSALFSFYVSSFSSYDRTYGSLGAVIVLLMWFYVSAIAFLTGALVDAEIDRRDPKTKNPRNTSGGL